MARRVQRGRGSHAPRQRKNATKARSESCGSKTKTTPNWKDLGKPQVSNDKATIKVKHFSVLLLVEDDSPGAVVAGDGDGDGDGPQSGQGDGGTGPDVVGDVEPGPITVPKKLFTAFPVHLAADCPAEGCGIQLAPLPYDGIWRTCDYAGDPASFDPATVDLAQACATKVTDETLRFVHKGTTMDMGSDCETYTEALEGNGHLAASFCMANGAYLARNEEQTVLSNGILYSYETTDCDGTCSLTLDLEVLVQQDTTTLSNQCLTLAEQWSAACPIPGVAFPFGPSAVGTQPPALAGTLWIHCDGASADIVTDCATTETSSYQDVTRFNANGTRDRLYREVDSWTGEFCGMLSGGTSDTLRYFFCGDGEVEMGEADWGIQTIAGKDYLSIDYRDGDSPSTYVKAPTDYVIPSGSADPCFGAPAQNCVLE